MDEPRDYPSNNTYPNIVRNQHTKIRKLQRLAWALMFLLTVAVVLLAYK